MGSGNTRDSTDQITEHSLGYVLDFQRYEFKYLIPNAWAGLIVSDLTRLMDFDAYSQGANSYDLYSVYFDTSDWQAYYEKMDGVERRKKFRVRSYEPSPAATGTVMLEIKEKNKDIILKRRLPVSPGQVADVIAPGSSFVDEPVAKEWRFSVLRDALKPRVLVRYRRMAFVPKGHGDFRITLDQAIEWGRPHSAIDFSARTAAIPALRGFSVLEVKFAKRPPKFIFELIKRYNLRNEAISKYCESAIAMNRIVL